MHGAKIESYQNLRVALIHSLLQKYNPLLQILSFVVISQKSEFFVKNGLNKTFYFLKVNIYIYIYIEFKIIFN